MRVESRTGDTSDQAFLQQIDVGSYENVIVLSYSDLYPQQEADAITLVTLLHLRDLADRHAYRYSIVSEMLDVRDRALAEVTRADDFIVSDELISLLLSQISENKHLGAVFADIFDPEGSEIYLKPYSDYIQPGAEVNFYTVVTAALRRNQVAIGYRRKAHATDASKSYGVVINPSKSQSIIFAEGDCVIVVAEE
jgi:hypothetical protein